MKSNLLFDIEPLRSSLLNRLRALQLAQSYITDNDVEELSAEFDISLAELEGVISFYHFLHRKPAGRHTIYLNDSLTSRIKGYDRIKEAFENELGVSIGNVDRTGEFGLFATPCIGLCDQEPAALIDFHPFTNLNASKVKYIIHQLQKGVPVEELCDVVEDNIRFTPQSGTVFFDAFEPGNALLNAIEKTPEEIIEDLKKSQLSGRGGAFFPTWIKWDSTRKQPATPKFIICNADEGEPGTFKDRVLMNAHPETLIEGMAVAGYTAGATYGVIYLRGEYQWLQPKLQQCIYRYHEMGLLGKNIKGKTGFDFDIRIQMGAGAYVCGEETALLESMEGKRGEPRTKWYFPVERGYLQKPTIINNVETLCAVARIMDKGEAYYGEKGIPGSPGTKVISVSGDCSLPGIYEIEWGMTVAELLEMCEAENPRIVQVSGPSGECIGKKEKFRRISMLDLMASRDIRCGGAFTIYSTQRDIIDILLNHAAFFKHESCGICTPCRAGNFLIERKLEKIKNGLATPNDLDDLKSWGLIMKASSRCGLGKTAPNGIIMAMDKFHDLLNEKLYQPTREDEGNPAFDLKAATAAYEQFKN